MQQVVTEGALQREGFYPIRLKLRYVAKKKGKGGGGLGGHPVCYEQWRLEEFPPGGAKTMIARY